MKKDSFVTISIKEKKIAESITSVLQYSGIETHVRPIKRNYPYLPDNAIRLRVHEKNISKALRIIQDYENDKFSNISIRSKVLVPVDYQYDSLNSLILAYDFALKNKKELMILHVYNSPRLANDVEKLMNKSERKRWRNSQHSINSNQLKTYVEKQILSVYSSIQVPITYHLKAGIAEQVIEEMVYQSMPEMVIMSTRKEEIKKKDSIGSISVQVINRVVIPIILIPTNYPFSMDIDEINVLMLCHPKKDSLSFKLEQLIKIFGMRPIKCSALCIQNEESILDDKNSFLIASMQKKYPSIHLKYSEQLCKKNEEISLIKDVIKSNRSNLIIINNHKHTMISRIFKRSLASRVAYECDIPLIVVSRYR